MDGRQSTTTQGGSIRSGTPRASSEALGMSQRGSQASTATYISETPQTSPPRQRGSSPSTRVTSTNTLTDIVQLYGEMNLNVNDPPQTPERRVPSGTRSNVNNGGPVTPPRASAIRNSNISSTASSESILIGHIPSPRAKTPPTAPDLSPETKSKIDEAVASDGNQSMAAGETASARRKANLLKKRLEAQNATKKGGDKSSGT